VPRHDGRSDDALRAITITPSWLRQAYASALITMGDTKVLCAVSVEDRVPPHLKDSGQGWVTGEYAMLPASGHERTPREVVRGRPSGRTMEIQRLIGRALRAVVDRKALGSRTLWVDCDVLQADGGTRTAAITGGYVALMDAVESLLRKRSIASNPIHGQVAAVSVGICSGAPVLDLDYAEDSSAETDMNVVMNNGGAFIEIQGTAEGHAFRRHELDELLNLAAGGVGQLLALQLQALAE